MDISMDIHEKYVHMDMDMDVIFHIHGNPGRGPSYGGVECTGMKKSWFWPISRFISEMIQDAAIVTMECE